MESKLSDAIDNDLKRKQSEPPYQLLLTAGCVAAMALQVSLEEHSIPELHYCPDFLVSPPFTAFFPTPVYDPRCIYATKPD